MAERANSFADLSDLSEFTPTKPPVPNREEVRAVAERGDFVSREPKAKAPKEEQRRYRTGRNVQTPGKVTQAVLDDMRAVTDARYGIMGITIEKAMAALHKKHAREAEQGQEASTA